MEIIEFDGEAYLAYRTFPIDVGIIRGTTADLDGNVTMEREALTLEVLAIAMAAKNSGGIVIVQVERIAASTMKTRRIIPGVAPSDLQNLIMEVRKIWGVGESGI